MTTSKNHGDFALMEYVEARRLLAEAIAGTGGMLRFSVLHPVYPSLGCGKLRVLRVRASTSSAQRPSNAESLEVVCGYESYERVDG